MAILPDAPGLRVEVCVGGTPLREWHDYDGEEQEDEEQDADAPVKTVIKYIEAEEGQNFELRFSFGDAFRSPHGVEAAIKLDGKSVRTAIWKTAESRATSLPINGASSWRAGRHYVRKWRFRSLDIVEDNESTNGQKPKDLHNLGQISVDFRFITNFKIDKNPSDWDIDLPQHDQIAEKALKGRVLSHCGKLDDIGRTSSDSTSTYTSDYVDSQKRPFAKFAFKYRSKPALKALQIIPRSPSPVQLEDRPEEELSQAELRELVRRLKAGDAAAAKIKKEAMTAMKRGRDEDDDEERDEEDDDVAFVAKHSKKTRRLPGKGDRVVELD